MSIKAWRLQFLCQWQHLFPSVYSISQTAKRQEKSWFMMKKIHGSCWRSGTIRQTGQGPCFLTFGVDSFLPTQLFGYTVFSFFLCLAFHPKAPFLSLHTCAFRPQFWSEVGREIECWRLERVGNGIKTVLIFQPERGWNREMTAWIFSVA